MMANTASHRGLTSAEAAQRFVQFGPNEIQRESGPSVWLLLARQFNSPVIWLLIGACVVSVGLGEAADAMAIVAIVILNGVIGFAQERRAERAILALQSMTAPRARVRRDGVAVVIPAAKVVPATCSSSRRATSFRRTRGCWKRTFFRRTKPR